VKTPSWYSVRRRQCGCLSAAVFAFALLNGLGCSPSAKPVASAAAEEPGLPKTPPATPAAAADESAQPKPAAHAVAKEWYSPREADFRPAYDHDAVNQAKESWSEYWSWVQTFYTGNLFSPGWTAQGTTTLRGVQSEETRGRLRSDLNDLGRVVAAEWSKDNGVRKIDTAALRVLGARITKAAKADDGSGKAIQKELDAIQAEVKDKLSAK
jgi:hypothetical protein